MRLKKKRLVEQCYTKCRIWTPAVCHLPPAASHFFAYFLSFYVLRSAARCPLPLQLPPAPSFPAAQISPAMPPRLSPSSALCLPIRRCAATVTAAAPLPLESLLASLSLSSTARPASILARLGDAPGATHNLKRVGRGPSSGHGRTSGRGSNGQKVHGKVKPWFQGGQTPLVISRGTKGFDNM